MLGAQKVEVMKQECYNDRFVCVEAGAGLPARVSPAWRDGMDH